MKGWRGILVTIKTIEIEGLNSLKKSYWATKRSIRCYKKSYQNKKYVLGFIGSESSVSPISYQWQLSHRNVNSKICNFKAMKQSSYLPEHEKVKYDSTNQQRQNNRHSHC